VSKQGAKDNPSNPHDPRPLARVPQKGGSTGFQFVHFKVSGADFGVAVDEVKEIIPYTAPARGSAAMEGLAGFVLLRDISVPLIDIRKRFSLPSLGAPPAKILIVRFEGRIVGIIADEVIDVEQETPGAEGAAGILMITTSEIFTLEEKRFFDSPYVG